MKNPKTTFGTQNKKECIIFAEEAFHVQIQNALYKLMKQKRWDETQFADAIDMDPATLNQIMDSDCCVDVRTLGKMFYVLGVTPKIIFDKR